MACRAIKIGDSTAVVCGRRAQQMRCKYCRRERERLCDYQVTRNGRAATCNAPMCAKCAINVGPNKDYCRPHFNISGAVRDPQPSLFEGESIARKEGAQ